MSAERARYLGTVIPSLVESVRGIDGDLAEFGVLAGESLLALAKAAGERRVHAVDSFEGMAEPTEEDGAVGRTAYPRGRFSRNGSTAMLSDRLGAAGLKDRVLIWKGFIPAVLAKMEGVVGSLALVHVDLDHYAPTKAALAWSWERLAPGGVVLMHDWFPMRAIYLASRAIRDFRRARAGEFAELREETGWMWVRKRKGGA